MSFENKDKKKPSVLKDVFSFHKILMRLFASWCASAFYNTLVTDGDYFELSFIKNTNILSFLTVFFLAFFIISFLALLSEANIDPYMTVGISYIYILTTIAKMKNIYFTIGMLLVLVAVGYYLFKDNFSNLQQYKLSKKATISIIVFAGLFFILFVGGLTVLRYLSYSTPTYDFGIFSQMFYNMKKTGLPITTCERNMSLSHFDVHFSPIFYLLLPGYIIFPSPVYLQIAQAVILASGLIPLYKLAKHFDLGNKLITGICVAYCFYPVLAGGCFYDIHENFFLTPLLLWVFLFLEKQKWSLMYLFSVLTLLVKEDAPVYIACIGLFLLFSRKERMPRIHGVILFIVSFTYFSVILQVLTTSGEGALALNSRLGNFISDSDKGIISIFKTIIVSPVYVISQIFNNDSATGMNQEKIFYMLVTILPLAGLPFLNKKFSQFILIIPYFVFNLMSNYQYMYDIGFQYHFGITAIFFYLAVANISKISIPVRKYLVPFVVTASIFIFTTTMFSHTNYITKYFNNKENFKNMDAILNEIPEEASVQASGFLVPKLSNRTNLYDIRYNHKEDTPHTTDYIVLDARSGIVGEYHEYLNMYLDKGYTIDSELKNFLVVLKK